MSILNEDRLHETVLVEVKYLLRLMQLRACDKMKSNADVDDDDDDAVAVATIVVRLVQNLQHRER